MIKSYIDSSSSGPLFNQIQQSSPQMPSNQFMLPSMPPYPQAYNQSWDWWNNFYGSLTNPSPYDSMNRDDFIKK